MIFVFPVFPSPVPEIRWKKVDGRLPYSHEIKMEGAQLHLYNVQFEDGGTYTCEAMNSRGKDFHSARLLVEGKRCIYMSLHMRNHRGVPRQPSSA